MPPPRNEGRRCPSCLTIMLVCAGLFVVVSHHVFQPEVVHRKIRRQQSVSKSVASSLNAAVAANPEHSMAATRDTAAPESPVTAATAEPHHTAQPAPTRNLASMLTQASLASSALVPYEEQSGAVVGLGGQGNETIQVLALCSPRA